MLWKNWGLKSSRHAEVFIYIQRNHVKKKKALAQGIPFLMGIFLEKSGNEGFLTMNWLGYSM